MIWNVAIKQENPGTLGEVIGIKPKEKKKKKIKREAV